MKKAFTLAEVLITLSIIGVVAAMTIPTLSHKLEMLTFSTGFKKAYGEVQQIGEKLKLEYDGDIYGSLYSADVNLSVKSGLAAVVYDQYKKGNKSAERPTANSLIDKNGKVITYKNFSGKGNITSGILDDGSYFIFDGRAIFIEGGYSNRAFMLTYDINGINKPPNRFGYDTFSFILGANNKFYPAGSPVLDDTGLSYQHCAKSTIQSKSTGCNISYNGACNGIGCAYYAMSDPNYFNNLK